MGMKNSWYSGLATVDFRRFFGLAVIFRIDQVAINKGFFDLPKQMPKSIFLVRHRKTLIVRKIIVFSGLLGFSSAGRKKWIADLESTPQKTYIKKRKRHVFLYVHKVK